MFSGLDKIDIVYEKDGRSIGVQTDHRTTTELEADEPRSIIFTLTRVLRPLSSETVEEIEYAFAHPPSPRLREAVDATGCTLRIGNEEEPSCTRDDDLLDAIAARALEEIGRAVLSQHNLEITEDGLVALEQQLKSSRDVFAEWDEEQRYTALLELGAAAGVVAQSVASASWIRDDYFEQEFPFTVESDGNRFNLFSRAQRFYEESPSEGPSAILLTRHEGVHEDGPLLPVLRLAGFGGQERPRSKPLVTVDPEPPTMPHLFVVQNRPQTIAYGHYDTQEDFETMLEASLLNLGQMPAKPHRVEGDLPYYIVDDGYFSTSKILDRTFLAGLAESLNTEMLMIGLPAQQVAIIAPVTRDFGLIERFVAMIGSIYQEQPESQQLSQLVFLATPADGVQALLQVG